MAAQLRRLADLAEGLAERPRPVVREAVGDARSSHSDHQSVRDLCDAVYALIASGQQRGGGPSYGDAAVIPTTNRPAVTGMLARLQDASVRSNRSSGELLMESRSSLLRRLGRPTEVEMSQIGSPIWRYETEDGVLVIDFSVAGYVIGMRRSERP